MSEALVKIPNAPLGVSQRKLAASFLVLSSITVALGQITHNLGMIGCIASTVLLGGWFMARQWRDTIRFNRENAAALVNLTEGHLVRARECFWRWAETTRSPNVAALARHNLGWTLIWLAELDQAIAVLADSAERYATELRAQKLLHRTHVALGLAQALRGDCDAAIASVRKATALNRDQAIPNAVCVVAIAEIRGGRAESAAKALEDGWVKLEAAMTGRDLRPMRIVRAFALAAAGVRAAGTASAAIAGLRPTFPGEFDFLGVAWPEMATFLASHDLAG